MNTNSIKNVGYGVLGTVALVVAAGIVGRQDKNDYEKELELQAYNDSINMIEEQKMERYKYPLGTTFEDKTISMGNYLEAYLTALRDDSSYATEEYNQLVKSGNANDKYAKYTKECMDDLNQKLDYYEGVKNAIDEMNEPKKSAIEHIKDSLLILDAIPKIEGKLRKNMLISE